MWWICQGYVAVGLPAIVTSGVGPETVSWTNYFKPAVCRHTLGNLANFVWWRAARWLRTPHRWKWKDLRRRLTAPSGRWKPIAAGGVELFNQTMQPRRASLWLRPIIAPQRATGTASGPARQGMQ